MYSWLESTTTLYTQHMQSMYKYITAIALPHHNTIMLKVNLDTSTVHTFMQNE